MNFSDLRNQPDTNMQVFGTPQRIEFRTFNSNQNPQQVCEIVDDAGEMQKVKVYPGKSNPDLEQFHVRQRLEFNLSARPNTHKPGQFLYGGFWRCSNPQQVQQPPQGYQPPHQPPPQAAPPADPYPQRNPDPPQQPAYQPPPQPQNAPGWTPTRCNEYAFEVTPEVAARICRCTALEAASRCFIGRPDILSVDVLSMAMTFWDWLATGNVPQATTLNPEPAEDPFR